VETLSDTPSRGSRTPQGAGVRSGMVKRSREVTWNSARRCMSEGERRPNWRWEICLGVVDSARRLCWSAGLGSVMVCYCRYNDVC